MVVAVATAVGWLPAVEPLVSGPSAGNVATFTVAGATLLLADFTALLAWFTGRSIAATRREAKIAEDSLVATKRQADIADESLREIRRTRELDWRPFLVRVKFGEKTVGGRAVWEITIQNIGRGPALNCLYVREEMTTQGRSFLKTDPINLAAGAPPVGIEAREQDQAAHPVLFHRNEFPRELLLCQDQFGTRYRFTPGYPTIASWSYEDQEVQVEDEPGWSRAMEEMLYARRPIAQPQSRPGDWFVRQVNVGMASSACYTTVALEEVPPSDVEPDDDAADLVEKWMKSVNPGAVRRSPLTPHWQVGDAWDGWLWAGPGLSVREVVPFERVPVEAGQEQLVLVRLRDLTERWRLIIDGGLKTMQELGSRRTRLGLTLLTWGAGVNQYRISDVSFDGLPQPKRWVTPEQINHWRYLVEPFDDATLPQQALEAAVRNILRVFGYRDVDDVIAALNQ